ncbi:MAG TPA: hypothetical protein VF633_10580 [Brevundimonas sp.]|jgi:hypothetical protein
MLKSLTALAVASSVLLAGCDSAEKTATPVAPAPVTAADTTAARAAVRDLIAADGDCTPDRIQASDRAKTKDFGGVLGVVAGCSTGIIDVWSRLYLARPGAAPVAAPLLVFDIRGDGEWHAESNVPNLVWSEEAGTLEASIRSQTTNCGWDARWRWDGTRMALVEMKTVGCDAEHSTDVVVWPTTPATPEPTPTPIPVD